MTQGVFLIREIDGETRMKNFSPSTLQHIHGLTYDSIETFMFEFFVVYRTYEYASDDQNLKLFPSTLKDAVVPLFMGFPGNSITTSA